MLNLLPQTIKDRYRISSRLYAIGLVYFFVLVVTVLGALGIATYNLTATANLGQKQVEIDALAAQKQNITSVTAKAAFIEDRMQGSAAYQEKAEWEKTLQQVADATPTNVQLTSLRLTSAGIDVSGKTTDRRAIVLFADRLTQQSAFSSANIQSINEEKATSGAKSFTFTINLGVKK